MASAALVLSLLLAAADLQSGLQVGEAVPSWQPMHVAGPDRGTRACPTCTYGARPMIQVFTKDGPNAALLAAQVEALVAENQLQELKGFVTVTDGAAPRLRVLARRVGITKAALCYPAPARADEDLRRKLKINPAADNTIIVYKDFVVTASFVNVDGHAFGPVAQAVRAIVSLRAPIATAIRKALPLVQASSGAYVRDRACFSCHHQAVPVLALTAARAHGFAIDEDNFRAQLRFTVDALARGQAEYTQGRGQGGQVTTAGYALWTLATGGAKPDALTSAVAHYLIAHEPQLDHWQPAAQRPPMEASAFMATFLALRALRMYGPANEAAAVRMRTQQARAWLQATSAADTEDHVFRLRGLHELGVAGDELRAAVTALVSAQRPDGGWAQTATLPSDAYATATVLAALHEAGGTAASDPAYQRGLQFLLRTQRPDGTWWVRTRSKPVQPYFESGFPHARDQFVSMAATSWAVLALALAAEPQARGDVRAN
jgi:hypothetical protein